MPFGGLQSRTRRAALATALVCLLALFHSGCSAFARIPTPEPVTIAFSFAERDQEVYERLAFKFGEQYSNITVELRPRRRQGQDQAEAGEVDVLMAPESTLRELHARQELLDVQPFIDRPQPGPGRPTPRRDGAFLLSGRDVGTSCRAGRGRHVL